VARGHPHVSSPAAGHRTPQQRREALLRAKIRAHEHSCAGEQRGDLIRLALVGERDRGARPGTARGRARRAQTLRGGLASREALALVKVGQTRPAGRGVSD
jgi:hypothetical protein